MKIKIIAFILLLLTGCHSTIKKDIDENSLIEESTSSNVKYVSLNSLENENVHSVWKYLSREVSLPIPVNKRIKHERERYLHGKTHLENTFQTSGQYLYWVMGELKKRNMPAAIAVLPIVESGFSPFATSPAQAAGIWQIVPSTGTYLGLKQTTWYDGRRDIIASTNVALDYLEQLHQKFNGDWLLTIAAYNSGVGRVQKAIKQNKAKGKPTDFWSLSLPKETSIYVPRWLALVDLIKQHKKYNITLPENNMDLALTEIRVDHQIELLEVAQSVSLTLEEVKMLNPGYKHNVTPPNGPHIIILPSSKSALFIEQLKKKEINLVQEKNYVCSQKEEIADIAKKYNSHIDAIKSVNHLEGNTLSAGTELVIPVYSQHVYNSLTQKKLSAKK